MKITSEDIGKKVRLPLWAAEDWTKVMAVGEEKFFGIGARDNEYAWFRQGPWEYFVESVATVEMFPAIVLDDDGRAYLTDLLYVTEEDARRGRSSKEIVLWPAKPNANGGYDVPVKGETI